MKKPKYIFIFFLFIVLILSGASCGKKEQEKKQESKLTKGTYSLEKEGVPSGGGCLKVSGEGKIIYFFDADKDEKTDSLVVSDAMGKDKKTIKIKGGLLKQDIQIDVGSLAVSDSGKKIVFSATPSCERDEYSCPKYLYILDPDSEKLIKVKNQDLSEKIKGAGWADPIKTSLTPDGEKIVFTVRFWGIDFGSAYDISAGLAVVNSDGSGLELIKEGKNINTYYLAVDDSQLIFYLKKEAEKFEHILNRINSDGSGEKSLGIKVSPGDISASRNGRIAGLLDEKDEPVFVCDFEGNIIAKGGNPWGVVEISGNGEKVLAAEWNKGLVFYQTDNNFEKEQVLESSYGNCAVHGVSNNGKVSACLVYKTGELLSIIK